MSFPRGQRIQRPEGTGPSWYLTALSQVRREAYGDVMVHFEMNGSDDITGRLDQPQTVVGPLGTIVLGDGEHVLAHDIEAFTLLPDPPAEEAAQ
jgi:hypothetical protein